MAERLREFSGISAQPLYHPGPNADLLRCDSYGDYVFYPSRLDRTKRHDLLIKAMKSRQIQLAVLAQKVPGPGRGAAARPRIARQGVAHRVKLMGFVDERELIKYYSNALAVYFGPFGEDYGYVTLEAFYAKKPVLTLTDSGAPLEFVRDGIKRHGATPDPAAIARAMDLLFEKKATRRSHATAGGWQTIQELRLGWDKVGRG